MQRALVVCARYHEAMHAWLLGGVEARPLPLGEVLDGSLYYPASYLDARPIHAMLGVTRSFVYVDYGVSKADFGRAAPTLVEGFRLIASRPVDAAELAPGGFHLPALDPDDGDPERARLHVQRRSFATWCLYETEPSANPEHDEGLEPERFSLLFVCADGAAAFHAMYLSAGVAPRIVALIQAGEGFGGNWTSFLDEHRVFGRSVLGNPAGKPEYLLWGGLGERRLHAAPCWNEYSDYVGSICPGVVSFIGLWRRAR